MNETLVVVEFSEGVPERWTPRLDGDAEDSGFIGGSVWTALDGADAGLGLVHFAHDEAAEAQLRARVEGYPEGGAPAVMPSAVRRLHLEGRHGMRLESTHVGGYLTLVHRLAAPGYGAEESEAIDEAMEAIEPLEGYAGHLRGTNAALPDEVWGLVFWSAPPLVPHIMVDDGATVAHYRRVR